MEENLKMLNLRVFVMSKELNIHFQLLELPNKMRLCHAPDPGPSQLADPNRFSGRDTQDWDSLPDFFFFLKANQYLWVWPTSYNRVKISYTFTESHLHIQN